MKKCGWRTIPSCSNGPSSEDMLLFTGGTFKKKQQIQRGLFGYFGRIPKGLPSIEIAPGKSDQLPQINLIDCDGRIFLVGG